MYWDQDHLFNLPRCFIWFIWGSELSSKMLIFFRFLGKSLPVPAGSSLLSQSGFFSDSLVEFMILYKNPTGLGLCSFGGGWEPGGMAMCSLCLGRLFYLLSPGEHSLLPVLLKPWLCTLRWSNSLLPLAFFLKKFNSLCG